MVLTLGCLVTSFQLASADILGTSISIAGLTGSGPIASQAFTVTGAQEIACPSVTVNVCAITGLLGIDFMAPDVIAFAFSAGTIALPTILLFDDIDSPPLGPLLSVDIQATFNISSGFDASDIALSDVSGVIPGLDRIAVNLSSVVVEGTPGIVLLKMNFAPATAPVPEPATFVLMGSVLAGLLGYKRYRTRH